jgi:hypothetical protein
MKKKIQIIISCLLMVCGLQVVAQPKVKPSDDTSVLKIPAPTLTFLGNNNSFNIYKATPDNMLVAKPDSTVRFNMPNGFRGKIIMLPLRKKQRGN